MVDILKLAKKTNFREVDSIAASMEVMATASDTEIDRIMFYQMIPTDQLYIKTAISLATLERERRAANAARDLAFKTTKFASWMGIVGALIGAIVGAAFGVMFQSFSKLFF